MRRRALLAASAIFEDEGLPPESTTFEFPLYLNTRIVEKASDFLYRTREADDISNQLLQFWRDNMMGSTDSIKWPQNFFNDFPVFIDGYQVLNIYSYWGSFENIKTLRDYGDYAEVKIFFDESELWVEGYN